MSSLRNAVKRITHKERSQPHARRKFGLLEKHKDYVERARDYNRKQGYLTVLKKKAKDRNPDEFYFGMHSSQMNEKGEHKSTVDNSLTTDTVKLLKSQDYGYIVHKKSIDDKKVQKMKKNLHLIGEQVSSKRKHFKFDTDSNDTKGTIVSNKRGLTDQDFEIIERQVEQGIAPSGQTAKKVLKYREKAYKDLQERSKRAAKLDSALQQLTDQRNRMGKGSKKKVGSKTQADGEEVVQYKWKRRRQK